jgi:hypothetical protein
MATYQFQKIIVQKINLFSKSLKLLSAFLLISSCFHSVFIEFLRLRRRNIQYLVDIFITIRQYSETLNNFDLPTDESRVVV